MTCRFIVVQSSLKEAEKRRNMQKVQKLGLRIFPSPIAWGGQWREGRFRNKKNSQKISFCKKALLYLFFFFALQVRQAKFASILSLFLCVGGRHRPPPPHTADSSAGRRRWVRVAVQSGRRTLVRYELAQELVALVEDALVLLLST